MILGRYLADNRIRVGARVDDQHVVDLELDESSWAPGTDPMTGLITGGHDALEAAGQKAAKAPKRAYRRIDGLHLLAPVAPRRLRNFSVYEGHLRNAFESGIEMRAGRTVGRAIRRTKIVRLPRGWYRRPTYYKGNHLSVVGPHDDIVIPPYTTQLDYELELAIVVGRPGVNISDGRALEHVFGYTLLNDVSARDVLTRELFSGTGPAKGKDFDTGNVLGPWLATRDEIPDPRALSGEVRVNGQVRSTCTTADMHHTVSSMVAEASRGETLMPAEVLSTGCCTWGSGIELMTFLERGDLLELTLRPFGTQRSVIV